MGFRKHMTEALDLPKEILLDLPLISCIGREEVSIENYKGIFEYGDEVLRVGTAVGIVRLSGKGLALRQMTADCLVVTGQIEKLEFLR